MKKLIFVAAMLLSTSATLVVNAQSKVAPVTNYVLPQTAIKVNVTVAIDVVTVGPYARFAQQYLGVTAPLNDKTTYTVASVDMESYDEADVSDIYVLNQQVALSADNLLKSGAEKDAKSNLVEGENGIPALFPDMGINPIVYSPTSSLEGRTSAREKSLEEMASDAAYTIFTLRKRRFDLITGDMGEGVFGAGLGDALKEMERIEKEYLSLFLGKSSKKYKTYSYDVTPEKGKGSYILARFSENGGMVEPTDMSGEPVVLTVTPEEGIKINPDSKGSKEGMKYRVADMAACKLFVNNKMVENERIAILQYGIIITK